MKRLSTIELFNDRLSFSAGHFTILSSSERESLHGHNYQVHCELTTIVGDLGMTFDYRDYKQKIYGLCRQLNQIFLIPGNSPYLHINEAEDYYYCHFNDEKIPFLKKDIKILPLVNITVEELSHWFLLQLLENKQELINNAIQKIVVKISSSPGQYGSSSWEK